MNRVFEGGFHGFMKTWAHYSRVGRWPGEGRYILLGIYGLEFTWVVGKLKKGTNDSKSVLNYQKNVEIKTPNASKRYPQPPTSALI